MDSIMRWMHGSDNNQQTNPLGIN